MRRTIDEQRSHTETGFDLGVSLRAKTHHRRSVDQDIHKALEGGYSTFEEYLEAKEYPHNLKIIPVFRLPRT